MVVKLAMLYGIECWSGKKAQVNNMHVVEMRVLQWMCGVSLRYSVSNGRIRGQLGVAVVEDTMQEATLRWFGYVMQRDPQALVRQYDLIDLTGNKQGRGRSEKELRRSYQPRPDPIWINKRCCHE